MSVRVRFAPSPTGPLHMGGVRTALYNYLFAKHNNGTFVLRIEDTDQVRFVRGAEDYIQETLEWCGIVPDEGPTMGGDFGPYRQSQRKDIYRQYADELIQKGAAYYAFDSAEDIDAQRKKNQDEGLPPWQYDHTTRGNMNNSESLGESESQALIEAGTPYTIRFKIPAGQKVEFSDEVRGNVEYDSSILDDKVIFKSDGMPTYHLANVVDDHLMEITHVIRGEEWLPSTPLHVLLYQAFGWEKPTFAHLPLILKPEGSGKLSKRDGDKLGFPVFPLEWKDATMGSTSTGYREEGYLPDAFINLLLMLGWNPGTEQEVFTRKEMIDQFSLDRVIKSGARFSPDKAKWFNEQYLRSLPMDELISLAKRELDTKGIKLPDEKIKEMCELMVERSTLLPDLVSAEYLFKAPTSYDEKTVRKKWKEHTPGLMQEIIGRLEALSSFSAEDVDKVMQDFLAEKELGFGQVGLPMRLLLSGVSGGPSIPAIAAFLGKEESLERMKKGLETIANG